MKAMVKKAKKENLLSRLLKRFKKNKEEINPELDIRVDIIRKDSEIIDHYKIYAKDRKFSVDGDKTVYKLKPKGMMLEPTKASFNPMYVYKEGDPEPYDFHNYNKRIPSRVINLLYNTDTYRTWLEMERKNLNLILVIIGVATLVVLGIYAWLNYGHGQIPNIPFISGGK
jgi:hypothetical protein